MKIEIRPTFDRIIVLFNDVPHLALNRETLVGFQSWKENGRHTIEWTFAGGATITTEYDDKEKWEAVLNGVNEVFLSPFDKAQARGAAR